MKLLDRYLLRQFMGTFSLVVLGVPFLFLITDLTDQLDGYLARGISIRSVAVSYVYYMPQLIFWGFPIAALIATVFTLGTMTRHQEIAAAKAGGISFYRIAAPLVLVAVLLSGVAIALGEVVPVGNQRRTEILEGENRFDDTYRMNFVFRTEDGRTISASRYNATSAAMENVVVERRNEEAGLTVHQSSTLASYEPTEGWTFKDGYLRWLDDSGVESTFHFEDLEIPELEESPDELIAMSARESDEMRYAELERYIRTVERSGQNANEYRVHLAQKVSLPLALLVIVIFGAPLATTNARGGPAFGIGVSLVVTMTYLMLFKVGEAVGTSGAVDPVIAAWAPNALFLMGGIYLLLRVRS